MSSALPSFVPASLAPDPVLLEQGGVVEIREAELTEAEWKPEGPLSRPLPGPPTLAYQHLPPSSVHRQPPQGGQGRSRVGPRAAASPGNEDEPGPELRLEVGELELPEVGEGL